MTRIFAHLGPEPAEASHETSSPTLEKVKAVLYGLLDCLKMLGYALKSFVYWMGSDNSASSTIFRGEIHKKSGNHAKFSEIREYVKRQRHPERVPERVNEIASEHGFTNSQTHFSPQFTTGSCTGGTILFCQRWFESSDGDTTFFDEFEGGVPLQGAAYQKGYQTFFDERYYHDLSKVIQKGEDTVPKGFDPEKTQTILECARAVEGDSEAIQKWALKNKEKRFGGKTLATLRDARGEDSSIPLQIAAVKLAGLDAQQIEANTTPGNVLRKIGTLDAGVYKLSFPTYGSTGDKDDSHTMTFVIQEEGSAYFYDTNFCIASDKKSEVQATIGRLFTHYTGLDYSTNLDGEKPSLSRRALNFIQESANPPAELDRTFSLLQITAASPARPTDATA